MQKVCSDVLELRHGRQIEELVEGRSRGVFSHNPLTTLNVNLVLRAMGKQQAIQHQDAPNIPTKNAQNDQ